MSVYSEIMFNFTTWDKLLNIFGTSVMIRDKKQSQTPEQVKFCFMMFIEFPALYSLPVLGSRAAELV